MDYLEAINGMFEELVPPYGKADSQAGELVRAVTRIGYRFWNDGDKIGVGYGEETCNPPARYILKEYGDTLFADTVHAIWGLWSDELYENGLFLLIQQVVEYIEEHPEMREYEAESDCVADYQEIDVTNGEEEEKESTTFVEPRAVYDPD